MNFKTIIINLCKKILSVYGSIILLSLLVFYVARLAPGDPLVSFYGDRAENMSPARRSLAEEKLGLHDPVHIQYIRWLSNALQGDFGISYKYKTDVIHVIADRLPNTLLLGGAGFLLLFILALLLGMFCAWQEGRWPDRIICRAGTISGCIPEFWLALVFILIFSVWLDILPGSGAYTPGAESGLADRLAHLVLPVTLVVISQLWYYAFMVRNKLVEEARADYVLLAKSKGLGQRQIWFRHCLPNAMPAYLSLMALSVPHILGGTYIIETVFSYPGIGTLTYESARYKDYNLLMLLCILSGTVVIFCGYLTRAVNKRIDPGLSEYAHDPFRY